MLTQTYLVNLEQRDKFGDLAVNYATVFKSLYPELKLLTRSPGCWGSDGEVRLTKSDSTWSLSLPDGKYSSNKHFHSSHSAIAAVESSRKKLNLAGCPLILLKTSAYNGDYRSLKLSYFLVGKNEDGSFFAHKIRPKIGATKDLDLVRAWIWQLKKGETVAARQGDLAFIPKTRKSGKLQDFNLLELGNHKIVGDQIWRTKHKTYVLNPRSSHHEHHSIELDGIFEVRLGKAWQATGAD